MKTGMITRLKPPTSGDFGTFGNFKVDTLEMYSLELAPHEDQANISCLRPMLGAEPCTYLLQNLLSTEHKRKLYHFTNIKLPSGYWGPLPDGRTVPEIHSGNLAGDVSKRMLKQILGCCLLGRAIVPFLKGAKFHAFGPESPTTMSLCNLEQDQLGVSSSVDAVQSFEDHMAGEDLELTIGWED